MRTFLNIFVMVFMILVLSCTKNPVDDIRQLPVVETMEVIDITDISALCKGKVIDLGDFPSPDFGIELNDGSVNRKYLSTQRSGNIFGVVFNNLLPSTTYTYRAFTEEGSTNFGKEKSFTTLEALTGTAALDPESVTTHSLIITFSNTDRLKEWGVYFSENEVAENDPVVKEFSKADVAISGLKAGTTY